jgi:hypothetical protein
MACARMPVVLTIWLVCFGGAASAQTGPSVQAPLRSVALANALMILPMNNVQGLPVSMLATITTVSTLADGTTITQVRKERRYRDGAGRTRVDLISVINGEDRTRSIEIMDLVAQTAINVNVGMKEAFVLQTSPAPAPHQRTPEEQARIDEQYAKLKEMRASNPASKPARPGPHVEALGERDIDGVMAEGTRVTTTTPAGTAGNDRELRHVTEQWISPELQIRLEQTLDQPLLGKTTEVISELTRNEPDPSLFQVPPGYTVVEPKPAETVSSEPK